MTYLPVDKQGFVDPDTVKKMITKETTLISVTHASSEVGTIEPIKEIVKVAKEHNITSILMLWQQPAISLLIC